MPDRLRARGALAALLLLTAMPPLAAAPDGSGSAQALQKGREAVGRGDGIAGEVELRRALDGGAPEAEVSALLGEAYLQQGDLAAARHWLEPGNFAADQRERGFHMLARLELADGNFDEALAAFEKALAVRGGTAEIWVDIGRMRYGNGQQHQALAASLEALKHGADDPRALQFRGQLVRDSRGLAAALPWFERGLKAAPDDAGLLGDYAATLGELGRTKDMLRVTRRMIELDGGNPQPFFLQAVLAARAGNYTLARRLLWRTEDKLDGQPAAMLLEGILEMQSGNWALAVQALDELARRQPENMQALNLFGRALLENGNAREVLDRFVPLADRPDASPYVLTLVGRAHEVLGDRLAAAPYLDRAAAVRRPGVSPLPVGEAGELAIFRWGDDPGRPDVAVARIRKFLAAGDTAAAASLANGLAEYYSDSSDVQVIVGDVALARGDAAAALTSYRAASLVRMPFSLVEKMAAAFRLSGQDRAARALVGDYLSQHPRDGAATRLLGGMMAESGDWRRAGALFGHAAALREVGRDPWLHGMIARAAIERGDRQLALDEGMKAYRMQRANGETVRILGRILQQAGRNDEARALFAKAGKIQGAEPG